MIYFFSRYIEEMTRVLKPGGKLVVATWCQRDDRLVPFSDEVGDICYCHAHCHCHTHCHTHYHTLTLTLTVTISVTVSFAKERKILNFLYSEWTHPHFISIQKYEELMMDTDQLEEINSEDWVSETIASWRHSIWVGVFDPWPVIIK